MKARDSLLTPQKTPETVDSRCTYRTESRRLRQEGSALTVTPGFAVVLIYSVLLADRRTIPTGSIWYSVGGRRE